ncbi:MAG: hypothetical protein SPLM_01160 [Spiroplasma phoeniceum]|uniref:hypothetical protein n=1 Tax=Spiroplasma phoeniceum TaxID=47835 RepID=UPI003288BE22
MGIYYDGYYWEGKGLPVNINDIKTFHGNGYQLIAHLGIDKLMRLVSSGSFIWGYSNIIVTDGGRGIDLMTYGCTNRVMLIIVEWFNDPKIMN